MKQNTSSVFSVKKIVYGNLEDYYQEILSSFISLSFELFRELFLQFMFSLTTVLFSCAFRYSVGCSTIVQLCALFLLSSFLLN